MANPAKLLVEIFESWRLVPWNETTESYRGDSDWSRHRVAASHLIEIERFLRTMAAAGQPADEFLEVLPNWTSMLLSVRVPWSQTGQQQGAGRPALDNSDLILLRALATVMDTANFVTPLGAEAAQRIVLQIQSADELIRTSSALGTDARRYLLGLTDEASRVIREIATFGEAQARHVVFELGGAMTTVAGQMPEPESATWRERAAQMMQELMLFSAKAAIGYGALKAGLPPTSA